MSFQSKTVFALVLILAVALGAWLDSESYAYQNCDTLCHERAQFVSCVSGNCVQYDIAPCLLCNGYDNVEACTSGDGSTKECVEKIILGEPMPDGYEYITTCDELCDCSNVRWSQATMTGTEKSLGVSTVFVCSG